MITDNQIHDACALIMLSDHPYIQDYDLAIARAVLALAAPADRDEIERKAYSKGWMDALRAVERDKKMTLAAVQAEPSGDVIALAEKCSAEVGRHEDRVVWVKFHSQASLEAFATGVVMSATVKRHRTAAQSADAVDATLSDEAVLSILRTYEARIKELTAAAVDPGEIAYQLTKRLVIDMPTARAAVDAALQSAAHPEAKEGNHG